MAKETYPPWNPLNERGYGAPPDKFKEPYQTPGRPNYLQGPYTPQTWGGGTLQESLSPDLQSPFTAPTMADVQGSPGYQTRLDAGLQARERSAAAQGSILSGGTQKAIERYAQDYGSNEYGNLFAQKLQGRQQNLGEAYANYQQRYGAFTDAANMDMSARGLNENAYQSDVSNYSNQYDARYRAYMDAIAHRHQAETDYWNRNATLANNGLTAAGLARP